MKLPAWGMLALGFVHSATAVSGIHGILSEEGVFRFTDGSSLYTFHSDGLFLLEPLGLSGRAVEGNWISEDHAVFDIIGRWTWYNGISAINDIRQMTVVITLLQDEPDTVDALWQGVNVPVYDVYFTWEELVPAAIEKAEE